MRSKVLSTWAQTHGHNGHGAPDDGAWVMPPPGSFRFGPHRGTFFNLAFEKSCTLMEGRSGFLRKNLPLAYNLPMLDILRLIVSRIQLYRHPLVDRGFGLIYDVERDITWLKDANYARTVGRSRDGQLTWNAAMAWVASLTYRGIGGWRLPTALNPDGSGPCTGNHCDQSEFGHLVFGPWTTDPRSVNYLNFSSYATYWTSTEASESEAFAFEMFNVRQGSLLKDPFNIPDGTIFVPLPGPVLAWPVHDGDVAAMIWERRFKWIVGARSRRIVL